MSPRPHRWLLRALTLLAGLATAVPLLAQDDKPFSPFITTPEVTVVRMLSIAGVGPKDHVIDLGSGDGRIPITAATRFGATGSGVDLDAQLVELSLRNARKAGVADRVSFVRGNVFETDVSKASVVTLYLLPPIVQALREGLLRQLRPGSRIVSHDFPFEGWQADGVETFFAPEKNNGRGGESTVFLYVVPADVYGRWQVTLGTGAAQAGLAGSLELRMQQAHQFVDVDVALGRQVMEAREGRVSGARVRFTVSLPSRAGGAPDSPWQFDAQVDGATMTGLARDDRGREVRWQARRTAAR